MTPAGEQRELRLLTDDMVAEQLSCSTALLRKWRRLGIGPKLVRISRLVRYQQSDLDDFIQTKKAGAAKKEAAPIEPEKERAA